MVCDCVHCATVQCVGMCSCAPSTIGRIAATPRGCASPACRLPRPTIALLYADTKDARHLKTYEIHLRDKDFGEGPWAAMSVEVCFWA